MRARDFVSPHLLAALFFEREGGFFVDDAREVAGGAKS
jgi:hypothetical protein